MRGCPKLADWRSVVRVCDLLGELDGRSAPRSFIVWRRTRVGRAMLTWPAERDNNKEELFNNIIDGKKDAINYVAQVNRSVKSEQRNLQDEAYIKLNQQEAAECGEN